MIGRQFNIGDKVRVIREIGGQRLGEVGEIHHKDKLSSNKYYLVFPDGGNFSIDLDGGDRIELIDTPIVTRAHATCTPYPTGIPGDLMSCQSTSPYQHSFSTGSTTTTKKGSVMTRLSLIAKKTFDKEVKTLIEAGVLDSDLQVCDDQFVLSFIVNQYKTELAALAQEQLDEAKASKGK